MKPFLKLRLVNFLSGFSLKKKKKNTFCEVFFVLFFLFVERFCASLSTTESVAFRTFNQKRKKKKVKMQLLCLEHF